MMSYIDETDFVIENKQLVYPEIVTDGLQLYYDAKGKRDTDYHRDTMLDMSGNKNHGKLHNFAYERHSGYKDGLVFDYIDDKLVRPTLNLQPNDFTFMLNGNIISFSPDGTVKRVQDGEVIESKGFNLIRNGDFSQGTSEWSAFTQSSVNAINGGLEWSKTNTPSIIKTDYYIDIIATQKYYIKTSIKGTSAQARINVYFRTNTSVSSNFTLDEVVPTSEINHSGILTATATAKAGLFLRDVGNINTVIIDNVICINLTATFGAGNEPTKEQMDEIVNRFGFIPNAQDLIDRVEYKGNDLGDMENIIDGLYKTEVLSGEEIYTDQADDAGVHVEIDGKSYQHAGSGKNMFNKYLLSDRSKFQLATYSSSPVIQLKPNTVYVISASRVNPSPDGNQLVLNIMDATDGVPAYGSPEYNTRRIKLVFNMVASHLGFDDFRAVFITPESGLIFYSYYDNNSGKSSEGNWFTDVMIDAQLEEGSTATAYEPPAPTPESPIEIHSLNDFDVVSSVGKRNYVLDGECLEKPIGRGRVSLVPFGRRLDLGEYTLSFDYEVEVSGGDPPIRFLLHSNGEPNTAFAFPTGGKWEGSTSATFNITERTNTLGLSLYGANNNSASANRNVTFRNIKLEKNEKTPYSPAPEDIAEGENHPFIDKINLSLDEPLRSVGDVKDRLFRDSDGLWKIERKIGSYTMTGEETFVVGAPSYDGEISTNRFIYLHNSDGKELAGETTEVRVASSHLKHQFQGWSNDIPNTCTTNLNQLHMRFDNKLLGVGVDDSSSQRTVKFRQYVKELYESGEPLTFIYRLKKFDIETLSQEIQDKLNNLRSFQDSNYIYTVINDRTDILSHCVVENLKPTLHAKFLYNNWYKEDRVINNLMIYNRALTNEEMLQNYKTIKRRWGM